MTKPGKATKPLDLPTMAPPCFNSQAEWDTYRDLAQYSAGDGFTYCSDCTPAYRSRMKIKSRCQFPDTQFRELNGVFIGRRGQLPKF